MEQTIPQPKKRTGKVILIIVLSLLFVLGTFAAGFAAGAAYIIWNNLNTGGNGFFDGGYTSGEYTDTIALKPVIYLYPNETRDVTVQLNYDGEIITDTPQYDTTLGGWQVTAQLDGTLTGQDGKHYPYLFWEGKPNHPERYAHPDSGFVIAGTQAEQFLRDTLPRLGLNESEAEEFIEFWLPKLKRNPYNLVHFAGQNYLDEAKLMVTPQPDSTIRVFMVMQPLKRPISLPIQTINTPQRTGFVVVEWGGMILP